MTKYRFNKLVFIVAIVLTLAMTVDFVLQIMNNKRIVSFDVLSLLGLYIITIGAGGMWVSCRVQKIDCGKKKDNSTRINLFKLLMVGWLLAVVLTEIWKYSSG